MQNGIWLFFSLFLFLSIFKKLSSTFHFEGHKKIHTDDFEYYLKESTKKWVYPGQEKFLSFKEFLQVALGEILQSGENPPVLLSKKKKKKTQK